MNISSKSIFWLAILIIGASLIFISLPSKNSKEPAISASPDISSSTSISVSPTPKVTPRPTAKATTLPSNLPFPTTNPAYEGLVQTPVPANLITGPATCQLEGSIVFSSANLYETRGAKMKFQNVDDSARLIFWKFLPNDGVFNAGPNIFANVKTLPNGELTIGATWQSGKTPTVKDYTLTAVITYGVKTNSGEMVKNSECTGSIKILTP